MNTDTTTDADGEASAPLDCSLLGRNVIAHDGTRGKIVEIAQTPRLKMTVYHVEADDGKREACLFGDQFELNLNNEVKIKYHRKETCNNCGSLNELTKTDSEEHVIHEADTKCTCCGFIDHWVCGFFESMQDGYDKCEKYQG